MKINKQSKDAKDNLIEFLNLGIVRKWKQYYLDKALHKNKTGPGKGSHSKASSHSEIVRVQQLRMI